MSVLVVYAAGPIEFAGLTVPPVAAVIYGTALGVLIDLDHFALARLETGTWAAARNCLGNPRVVFTDQDRIFERGDVGALSRLLSHLLLAGLLVPLTALASGPLAVLTGVVLYAHVVTDVAWDVRRLRRRSELSIDEIVPSRR